MEPKIDPARLGRTRFTGIPIRALLPDGTALTCDVAELDAQSFLVWLREGDGRRAEQFACLLLGHMVAI